MFERTQGSREHNFEETSRFSASWRITRRIIPRSWFNFIMASPTIDLMDYKHRKNYSKAFIVNLILWILWIIIFFFLSPNQSSQFQISNFKFQIPFNTILFFLTLTLTLTLTFSFLFANARRGFLSAIFLCGILLFRLLKICQWQNVLLLFLALTYLEYRFWKRSAKT